MSDKLKQDHYSVRPVKQAGSFPGDEEDHDGSGKYLAGRGAQFNTKNKFEKNEQSREHAEGIDDWEESNAPTIYMEQ